MNESTSGGKEESCCAARDSTSICCEPTAGNLSSCCSPKAVSWKKRKLLVSVIIIMAAIGVGLHSFVRGTSAQSRNTGLPKSFVDRITEMPITAAANRYQGRPQTKP